MGTSRLSQARKAIRPALKGRMMLSGPPGSGKTRTALIVAAELAEGEPILVIDTEKESALTYADDFDFVHLPWHPPFDPNELVSALNEASGSFGVIVVDSLTHFWRGEGGVLDTASGKFTGWKEARPIQEAMVDAILKCQSHMILGVRSKVDHVQELEGGRHVVKKLGMADQQDDNLAFEMNVAFELDAMDHTATATKSRTTAIPVGRAYRINQTAEMARTYRDWLKGGEPPAPAAVVEKIRARVGALPAELSRQCQEEFKGSLCLPKYLRLSQIPDAEALVSKYETLADPPADSTEASPQPAAEAPPAPVAAPPAPTAAPTATHDPNGDKKIDAKEASALHALAHRKADEGESTIDQDTFRALVFAVSNEGTDSAAELTVRQADNLRMWIREARAGRYQKDIDAVFSRWVEYATKRDQTVPA